MEESYAFPHFDFSPLFDPQLDYWVPQSFTPKDKETILERFKKFTDPSAKSGVYSGYRRQIVEGEGLNEALEMAKKLRENFDHLVVLGIGGSALGTRAIHEALKHQLKDPRKLDIVDNLDPVVFEGTWDRLDLSKTLFTIISKSGGTLETMAQASVVYERLVEAKLDPKKHIVAITDPEGGALRQWVNDKGLEYSLSVPSDVGGRFSVMTSVGLFPLAFAGHNATQFLRGAQDFFTKAFENGALSHPFVEVAHRLASLEEEGYSAHMLMPYGSVLKDLSAWFVQLWGESLGKEAANGKRYGAVPVVAVGATDQHSILQLLVEGPRKIVSGFLSVKNWHYDDTRMKPVLPGQFNKLAFAHNKSFGEILLAQSQATQSVLREKARPSYRIEMDELNEFALGAVMAFYMDLTSLVGASFDIDPYNQPGVEEGKKILPHFLQ